MIVYICDQCGKSEVLKIGLTVRGWEDEDDEDHGPDHPPLIIPEGWEPCQMLKQDTIQRAMCQKCIAEDDSDA